MINYEYQERNQTSIAERLSDYDKPTLHKLLHEMLRIRLIEEAVADRYHEDQMKTPIHLAIGQEAVSVGCCAALRKTDFVYCGHRTHGVYIGKGGDINAMFAEFHCKTTGCTGSRGGSMHLIDKKAGMAGSSAIVAGIVPIATGSALAAQMKKEDRVTFVFLGDAATEEGAVWESINFAVLKKLPIVYVCENNYYSVCSPLSTRQAPGVEIYKKAEGFGLPSVSIDGNNVLAVYDEAQKAAQRALVGEGPSFIEAHTYRWRGHHGAGEDFKVGYRSEEELTAWKKHGPIQRFRTALEEAGLVDASDIQAMQESVYAEIKEGFEYGLAGVEPTADDLLTHVYSE
jgi:pyruvate dehydrogenase E1 component alpha subunit